MLSVAAVQDESAVCMPICPRSWASLAAPPPPHPPLLGEHRALSWAPYSSFPSALHMVCIRVNTMLPSQLTPPSPSPTVSTHPFPTPVSLLPCKQAHQYHFSRSHKLRALIYNICFSLTYFHSVLTDSRSVHVSLQKTQSHSFLWLSNIPLHICTISSLSIHLLTGYLGCFLSWLL